jgi:hypothetical protein
MWRTGFLVTGGGLTTMLAGCWAAPLAANLDGTAPKEACHIAETRLPEFCPCTITKARELGLSDADLASLFGEHGDAGPVDARVAAQFWQVTWQCIKEARRAQPATGPGASARPAPGSSGPYVARLTRGEPKPADDYIGTAPIGMGASGRTTIPGRNGGSDVAEITRQSRYFDFTFSYSAVLANEPALFELFGSARQDAFRRAEYLHGPSPQRAEARYGWYVAGQFGPLLSIKRTMRYYAGDQVWLERPMLWDTALNREITMSDVFDTGIWNGEVRSDYCAALHSQRAQSQSADNAAEQALSCPAFEELYILLGESENGSAKLDFNMAIIEGYFAEGSYQTSIPVTPAIAAGLKEPYRAFLSAN